MFLYMSLCHVCEGIGAAINLPAWKVGDRVFEPPSGFKENNSSLLTRKLSILWRANIVESLSDRFYVTFHYNIKYLCYVIMSLDIVSVCHVPNMSFFVKLWPHVIFRVNNIIMMSQICYHLMFRYNKYIFWHENIIIHHMHVCFTEMNIGPTRNT